MDNPTLYRKSNSVQKRDAQDAMSEFSHLFLTCKPGSTLLDIGTGSGDVLADVVVPKLHENCTEVIGVDISPEMVKHANENYREKSLKFFEFDIQSKFLSGESINGPLKAESADFITSFYCLHWIQNQK